MTHLAEQNTEALSPLQRPALRGVDLRQGAAVAGQLPRTGFPARVAKEMLNPARRPGGSVSGRSQAPCPPVPVRRAPPSLSARSLLSPLAARCAGGRRPCEF